MTRGLGPLFAAALAVGWMAGAPQALSQGLDLDYVKRQIEMHKVEPAFNPPGPAFDAKVCMAGKRILTIPASSAIPFIKIQTNAMIEAGEKLGFEVVEWVNQGQPSQWAQGLEFAANNGFDLVNLVGPDPRVIAPQITAARAAGVIVKTVHIYDLEQQHDKNLDGDVPMDFNLAGLLIADWIVQQTNGKTHTLIVGSDDLIPTPRLVQGIKDTFRDRCGANCTWTYINAPVQEWATKIQPSVQAALLADPTINYVVPIYDSMSLFVVPAIRITGKSDKVKIATFNGSPFVLDFIRTGEVEMDVGSPGTWMGREAIDSHMRTLCGLPAGAKGNVPFYVFDASNAARAGVPAEFGKGYGDGDLGFFKLWGIN